MIHYEMKTNLYDKVRDCEKFFIERVESIISDECREWLLTMKDKKSSRNGGRT